GQTGDARKAEFIARQGAEEVVVADAANVGEAITSLRPTAVFDALGGGFTAAAVEALVPSGRLVSFGTSADQHATISMRALYRKGAQIIGYAAMVEPEERVAEAVSGALGALAEGVLPVAVERLPMSEFGTAFARLSSRGVTGKLVLDLGSG
ncbi:MAG: zinc-binding dehydrogenase, partial [Solirubrobacteraceae bacterium]